MGGTTVHDIVIFAHRTKNIVVMNAKSLHPNELQCGNNKRDYDTIPLFWERPILPKEALGIVTR